MATADVAGVALAGVKELMRENAELKAMVAELQKRLEVLERKERR
jgi:hypothetical protein